MNTKHILTLGALALSTAIATAKPLPSLSDRPVAVPETKTGITIDTSIKDAKGTRPAPRVVGETGTPVCISSTLTDNIPVTKHGKVVGFQSFTTGQTIECEVTEVTNETAHLKARTWIGKKIGEANGAPVIASSIYLVDQIVPLGKPVSTSKGFAHQITFRIGKVGAAPDA